MSLVNVVQWELVTNEWCQKIIASLGDYCDYCINHLSDYCESSFFHSQLASIQNHLRQVLLCNWRCHLNIYSISIPNLFLSGSSFCKLILVHDQLFCIVLNLGNGHRNSIYLCLPRISVFLRSQSTAQTVEKRISFAVHCIPYYFDFWAGIGVLQIQDWSLQPTATIPFTSNIAHFLSLSFIWGILKRGEVSFGLILLKDDFIFFVGCQGLAIWATMVCF